MEMRDIHSLLEMREEGWDEILGYEVKFEKFSLEKEMGNLGMALESALRNLYDKYREWMQERAIEDQSRDELDLNQSGAYMYTLEMESVETKLFIAITENEKHIPTREMFSLWVILGIRVEKDVYDIAEELIERLKEEDYEIASSVEELFRELEVEYKNKNCDHSIDEHVISFMEEEETKKFGQPCKKCGLPRNFWDEEGDDEDGD